MSEHEFDDDGICRRCGFDGGEWYWWETRTYEGLASETPQPACEEAA